MYGTWYTADGVQFTGHFVNNKPTGPGTFEFSNGHAQSGEFVYVKKGVREWKDSKFVAPSYDKPAPEPLSPSPSIAFRRLLDRSVLRADQYPGLDKVQAGERIAGVPNFHQTKNSSVFSMAQPTRKGVSELLGWLAEKGLNKVVVLNTRPDFCVYVQDVSLNLLLLCLLRLIIVVGVISDGCLVLFFNINNRIPLLLETSRLSTQPLLCPSFLRTKRRCFKLISSRNCKESGEQVFYSH